MNSKLATITLLAISLTGCGKFLDKFSRNSKGYTEVQLVPDRSGARSGLIGLQGAPLPGDVLQGGAIVYAVDSISGRTYSAVADSEGIGASLTLPNGTYNFYGVGWETSGLTTTPGSTVRQRCGSGGTRTLTGEAATVNVNLANLDECYNNSFFGPSFSKSSSPWNSIMSLKFVFCGKNTNQSTFSVGTACLAQRGSSYFYKGNGNDKMDRAGYFASSNTLMFSASKNPTSTPPTLPYELYKTDLTSGKQTKIGMDFPGTTPHGARKLKAIPSKQKLLFTRDNDVSVPDELWIYNLANGSLNRISHGTPLGGSAGVREFRVSDGGDWVVFVSDQDTVGVFELYSVQINSGDSYSAPVKISGVGGGAGVLTGTGVKEMGGCTGEECFHFQISPGTSNNYVVFSATRALASRNDLHIASMDGASFPGGTIHGSGPASVYSGTKISSTEISVANDFIDKVAFSHDGAHILYHAHVNTGPVEKIMQIDVSHVAGTSLTVPAPTILAATGATFPYFVTGKTTQRALYFTNDGTYALVHTVDMSNPGSTNYIAFGSPVTASGRAEHAQLVASDTKAVVAFKDATSVVEIRSGNVNLGSNYNGGSVPDGSSVTHTGGVLTGSKQVRAVSPNGGGGKYFLTTSDNAKLYFITDTGSLGIFKAYYGTVGTAGNTEVSGAGVATAGNSVESIALSATDIPFFSAAIDVASKAELYRTQLTGSPTVTRMNSHLQLDSIVAISGKDEHMAGFPDRIVIDAHPLGATGVTEVWMYNPSNSSYQRVSTLGGDGFGAGRFKVRMLKSADGGATYATAIEGGCEKLSGGQTDGDQITTNVRIPLGDGSGTSPFAMAIDVYPLATSCSGSPETFTFPNGPVAACTVSSSHCMLGSGPSNLVLFLNDK